MKLFLTTHIVKNNEMDATQQGQFEFINEFTMFSPHLSSQPDVKHSAQTLLPH